MVNLELMRTNGNFHTENGNKNVSSVIKIAEEKAYGTLSENTG